MSPRSQEFYDRARERLEGAKKNLNQGEYAIAVGAASAAPDRRYRGVVSA